MDDLPQYRVYRIEENIYCSAWSGPLSDEDALKATRQRIAFINQHGQPADQPYGMVIDLRNTTLLGMFSLLRISGVASEDPRAIAFAIVGKIAGVIPVVRTAARIAGTRAAFFTTIDDAVTYLRDCLRAHNANDPATATGSSS